MIDLKVQHNKLCPDKHLNNFWKSVDYNAARTTLSDAGVADAKIRSVSKSAPSHPSVTMVHPVVGLAFMRWADPALFYKRLRRIVEE